MENQVTLYKNTERQNKLLSPELEKAIEISNKEIQEVGHKVRKYKKQVSEIYDKMDSYMDQQTHKERKDLEKALAALELKINKVRDDDKYKAYEKEVEYIEKKLNITMENIFPYYAKAVKRIHNVYADKEERSQKLIEFHEVLGEAFLSKDERKVLKIIKDRMKELPHVVNLPLIGL